MKEFEDLKAQEAQVAAQVAERKGMALRKGLYKKIKFIATFLGEKMSKYDDDMDRTTIRYRVATGTIHIEFEKIVDAHTDEEDVKEGCVSVSNTEEGLDEGPWLFSGSKGKENIFHYIPGEWEKELDSLYEKAASVPGERQRAQKEEERQRRLKILEKLKKDFDL